MTYWQVAGKEDVTDSSTRRGFFQQKIAFEGLLSGAAPRAIAPHNSHGWTGGPGCRLQLLLRVPLDKSEGSVKGIVIRGSAMSTATLPERLRTKTLEISRSITLRWNSFHQPSIRPKPRP